MSVRLSEIERKYFLRKLNEVVPSTTPLNDIKVRYWVKYVGGFAPNTPFNDMEWAWMMKVLGVATASREDWDDAWKEMVISIGKTPSKYHNENQLIFYLNAP